MNRSIRMEIFIWSMLLLLLVWVNIQYGMLDEVKAENELLEAKIETLTQQKPEEENKVIEAPYTQVTNLSTVMYLNKVSAPIDAQYWTDVNGISGFDVTVGSTHYRYIEGHIQRDQLALYAPYVLFEEDIMWGELDGQ